MITKWWEDLFRPSRLISFPRWNLQLLRVSLSHQLAERATTTNVNPHFIWTHLVCSIKRLANAMLLLWLQTFGWVTKHKCGNKWGQCFAVQIIHTYCIMQFVAAQLFNYHTVKNTRTFQFVDDNAKWEGERGSHSKKHQLFLLVCCLLLLLSLLLNSCGCLMLFQSIDTARCDPSALFAQSQRLCYSIANCTN